MKPGQTVYLCFSSDFLVEDADAWRLECWQMIRERSDLHFLFLTKRIERFMDITVSASLAMLVAATPRIPHCHIIFPRLFYLSYSKEVFAISAGKISNTTFGKISRNTI